MYILFAPFEIYIELTTYAIIILKSLNYEIINYHNI